MASECLTLIIEKVGKNYWSWFIVKLTIQNVLSKRKIKKSNRILLQKPTNLLLNAFNFLCYQTTQYRSNDRPKERIASQNL
jgi:hypothetical protein